LTIIQRFLSDLQLYGNGFAPIKDARILILPEDRSAILKKPYDKTDYIPDFVLEQLFRNIRLLHKDAIPVVWIMFKTGLRISDALLLRQNCLILLNGEYWIETDIKKTYVEGHRIPIDEKLASMIAELIDQSKQVSNQDNNPDGFIFARFKGHRKGKPIAQYLIREYLNTLAYEVHVTDESGKLYHFTNHAFRHTYAVRMLNNGVDLMTIQDLLAHASPEMTLRYARLLDNTKREAFENAVRKGVFSFDDINGFPEEADKPITEEMINMLWTNHKLNALDTPYGTCLQRNKGKCSFAKFPPCLTCSAGIPCKDLCVGAFEGDLEKYEILISSAQSLIGQAEKYGREDMAKENRELLRLYQNIYQTVSDGNIIYGRTDRLENGKIE
jgi:integrase